MQKWILLCSEAYGFVSRTVKILTSLIQWIEKIGVLD